MLSVVCIPGASGSIRDELIAAALTEWGRSHGDDGLAEFAAIADPARRLRELLTAVVQAVGAPDEATTVFLPP